MTHRIYGNEPVLGRHFEATRVLWDDEVVVLDWFAPAERPPDVSELEYAASKRELGAVRAGRFELLEAWPDRRAEELRRRAEEGGPVTVGPATALHLVHGERLPLLV